jgi:plasmid stabilization system protein ParE
MKLVYSRRALADIDGIANYYEANASPAIAESIERRLSDVIDRICRVPEAAPRVSQRSLSSPRSCGRSLSIPDFLPGARRHNRYFAYPAHVEAPSSAIN